MLTDVIHYKTLFVVLARLRCIPPDKLEIIKTKPASTDRAADSAWRRECVAWNIDTSARQDTVADNRVTYDRLRHMSGRVATLEKDLSDALSRASELAEKLVKAEALIQFYQSHPRSE